MADEKERIAAVLVKARADLDDALFEMEKLPAVSQSAVNFAAHTLGNFLSVTGVTAELLQLELADHPEPQVHKWLDALILATEHHDAHREPAHEHRRRRRSSTALREIGLAQVGAPVVQRLSKSWPTANKSK